MSSKIVTDTQVAIRRVGVPRYPEFPYDPPRRYPEFLGFGMQTDRTNHVYEAVRNIFADLRLDWDNFGKSMWNPLRSFIMSGQRALIKPNWVLHANQSDGSIESLITHTSLIRTVIDYLILALDQEGVIEIADAPLQGCDFSELVRRNWIGELIEQYRKRFPGVTFAILDLRKTILCNGSNRITGIESQSEGSGDPRGYTLINLGQESLLTDIQNKFERFRVTKYDHWLMHEHHNREKHEYLVANSVLSADFILNLPKLKCHVKSGITGALKNLVGINGHKEYLPHHTNGCPATGGDQYQHRSLIKPLINRVNDDYWANVNDRGKVRNVLEALLIRVLHQPAKLFDRDLLFDGGWSGNDTIPRTTLDLNHALYFYDVNTHSLSPDPVRNVLHIVDGVIAGEGYGPLQPTPKASGIVLGGWNPLSVDVCGVKIIGLDPMKVRLLRYGLTHEKSRFSRSLFPPLNTEIIEDGEQKSLDQLPSLEFAIPQEWKDAAV